MKNRDSSHSVPFRRAAKKADEVLQLEGVTLLLNRDGTQNVKYLRVKMEGRVSVSPWTLDSFTDALDAIIEERETIGNEFMDVCRPARSDSADVGKRETVTVEGMLHVPLQNETALLDDLTKVLRRHSVEQGQEDEAHAPMKSRDRDSEHRRRRETGDEEDRDGLDLAERLYGGLPTDSDKIDEQTDEG